MHVHIRKELAGHASSGYTWTEDGAVVPVEPEHAAELLRIPDGGFTAVDPDDDDDELSEVDTSDDATDQPTKRPGRPRKTR